MTKEMSLIHLITAEDISPWLILHRMRFPKTLLNKILNSHGEVFAIPY